MRLSRRDARDLGVLAAVRDPCVQQLQHHIHVADLSFHQAQRLCHVPGKPLNIYALCAAAVLFRFVLFHDYSFFR